MSLCNDGHDDGLNQDEALRIYENVCSAIEGEKVMATLSALTRIIAELTFHLETSLKTVSQAETKEFLDLHLSCINQFLEMLRKEKKATLN